MENIIKSIKEDIDKCTTYEKPKIIFIGGIPGSGKTLLINKTKEMFSNEDFAVIEADNYRMYLNNSSFVEDTAKDANFLEEQAIYYAIENKKNIINISTLRAYEFIDNLIKEKVLKNNYEIYLYIIVTNELESILSTYERYIIDKNNSKSFARLNKLEYFTSACDGFKKGFEYLTKQDYVKEVKLFKRGEFMSLPIEINSTIEEEINNQMKNINHKEIEKRIENIRKKLYEEYERKEFENIYSNLIEKLLKIC